MATPADMHSGVAALLSIPGYGTLLAAGTVVPSDGTVGYSKHCLFIHTDGADLDAAIYLNVGSATSANFDPLNLTI